MDVGRATCVSCRFISYLFTTIILKKEEEEEKNKLFIQSIHQTLYVFTRDQTLWCTLVANNLFLHFYCFPSVVIFMIFFFVVVVVHFLKAIRRDVLFYFALTLRLMN